MAGGFEQIPEEVIDYVRGTFGEANHWISRLLTQHPAMHEPGLDQSFVGQLNANPPVFFAASQAAVAIETHWLGGRWLLERWEVADIAIFILLRLKGRLISRKVALLQTKRLYSKEITGAELDKSDYAIGIGRLVDRVDAQFPLSSQRTFKFDEKSVYGALTSGDEQIKVIDAYFAKRHIPVFYGFYNPMVMPFKSVYPASSTDHLPEETDIGMRVIPSQHVHSVTKAKKKGKSPSFQDMTFDPFDVGDPASTHGWRIERFVADEILKCRQGFLFENVQDERLAGLLYGRSAPITSAITITIDLAGRG